MIHNKSRSRRDKRNSKRDVNNVYTIHINIYIYISIHYKGISVYRTQIDIEHAARERVYTRTSVSSNKAQKKREKRKNIMI